MDMANERNEPNEYVFNDKRGDKFGDKFGDECSVHFNAESMEKCSVHLNAESVEKCSVHLNAESVEKCSVHLDAELAEATFVQVAPRLDETMIVVNQINHSDVGKKVCVGNSQTGVLKYLGEVRFNAGQWCGIELDSPVGKHDGCVKGVRYFNCRPSCGIMAPVAKVTLLTDRDTNCQNTQNSEKIVTDSEHIVPSTLNTTVCVREDIKNNADSTICVSSQNQNITRTVVSSDLKCDSTIKLTALESEVEPMSGPYSLLELEVESKLVDLTYDSNSTFVMTEPQSEQGLTPSLNLDSESINLRPSISLGRNYPRSKRLSSTFVQDLTLNSPDGVILQASTPIADSRRRNLDIIKKSDNRDNVAIYHNFTPTHSPADSSSNSTCFGKQNSFELDESLGILTPDEMQVISVVGSKTLSCEQFLSSRNSDTTISNSRTPSSENLGSLPHDGFKLPLPLLRPVYSENLARKTEKVMSPPIRPDTIDLNLSQMEFAYKSFMRPAISQAELASPSVVENSVIDFSLGLIDEDVLASGYLSSSLHTTTNLDLPLDSINAEEKIYKSRSDQTPSPEDLPLDPIGPDLNPILIPKSEMDLLSSNPSTDSDLKTDASKSTATKTNSFITSVTSITSLDTGYQGDGEMSRPASRGADHSPIAHKPNNPALVNLNWQRAIVRRQDPMTDSDFFTESDADIHDDNHSKGDRRAQVIDGTLYGAHAQPAAFIGNQEEMESSGVFTDLEANQRSEDLEDSNQQNEDFSLKTNENCDAKSPSDVSTKSISENSQEMKNAQDMDATIVNETVCQTPTEDITETTNSEKIKSPTPSPNTGNKKGPRTRTPLPKEESPNKKFKTPKRTVTSKVKSMMENPKDNLENQENRKPPRKSAGRWDAVMDKISKGQETKIQLKDVKSKISTGITGTLNTLNTNKRCENRKSIKEDAATKPKIRRVRARGEIIPGTKTNSRIASSVHSSLSDLSVGLNSTKSTASHTAANRTTKKRDTVGRCGTPVTEVLTPGGHKPTPVTSPRSTITQSQRITRELKKSPLLSTSIDGKPATRRTPSRRPGAVQPQPPIQPLKDQSRVSGGKGVSPPNQERVQAPNLLPQVRHSAKGVEALGVLVQYLVFNLDAFRTPGLKRELENIKSQWLRDKLELEETRMGYRRLEDTISEQKNLATNILEEERVKYRAEIAELFEKHRRDVAELNEKNKEEKLELERRLQDENSELKCQLDAEISSKEDEISTRIETFVSEHRYKIQELEQINERLRSEHQIAIEILREENDSIREQLDDKLIIKEELNDLKLQNEKLRKDFNQKEKMLEDKLITAEDEIVVLKEENKKILETFKSDTKDNKLQAALGRCTQLQDEVESLRSVLDLKLSELCELRRVHGEAAAAAEQLPHAQQRAAALHNRLEDLHVQLERKTHTEIELTKEIKRLQENFNQASKQTKRLSLHNEELQYKLKQNSEVVTAILQSQTPNRKALHSSNQSLCDELSFRTPTGACLSRSLHTSSFNEKHSTSTSHMLERTLSFRERTSQFYKDTSRKSESPNDRSSNKSDIFDDDSPPSSPKVKGVVEKSDSVSWVLDLDESPEILASRMVRRAGSFRNVTPPKSTPTKSPASKRPRTKSNTLSLSASVGAIPDGNKNDRHRSKSVSLRDSQSPESCHPGEFLSNSWHYSLRTSTPTKAGLEPIRTAMKLENNPDLEHESDAISLPALPSEISPRKNGQTSDTRDKADMGSSRTDVGSSRTDRGSNGTDRGSNGTKIGSFRTDRIDRKPDSLPSLPSGDLLLLQSSFPKSSAGEAMISESNSEDECCSSSERSPSVTESETETSEEADHQKKTSKLQYDLFLMTESTNSEAMDCSWSEELDV